MPACDCFCKSMGNGKVRGVELTTTVDSSISPLSLPRDSHGLTKTVTASGSLKKEEKLGERWCLVSYVIMRLSVASYYLKNYCNLLVLNPNIALGSRKSPQHLDASWLEKNLDAVITAPRFLLQANLHQALAAWFSRPNAMFGLNRLWN